MKQKNGFYLQVVSYRNSNARTVRLMRKDGAAHSSYLYGMMYKGVAEKLVEELGIPVDRVVSKLYMGREEKDKIKKNMGKKITRLKPIELQHHGLFEIGADSGK